MRELRLETLTGPAITAVLEHLAQLRISVFRAPPYLYDGDVASEAGHLAAFAASPRAGMVVAWDGEAAVGCSTCLPLSEAGASVAAPFLARGWELGRFFYFGESVLLPDYRGRGIGVRFFAAREAHAKAVSNAEWACFCAVIRDAEPDLAPFWRNRGFTPYPDLVCRMRWKQVDTSDEVENRLSFWIKPLHGTALP
jgi:GNAT superfamily N-acetyltransferase